MFFLVQKKEVIFLNLCFDVCSNYEKVTSTREGKLSTFQHALELIKK